MTTEEMEWSDYGRQHGPLIGLVRILLLFACIGVEVAVGFAVYAACTYLAGSV